MLKYGSSIIIKGHEFYEGAQGYAFDRRREQGTLIIDGKFEYLIKLNLTGDRVWLSSVYLVYTGRPGFEE